MPNNTESCPKCAPFDGLWMETENGLRRCDCPRGLSLREAAKPQPAVPPILTEDQGTAFAGMLGSIPFFPADSFARGVVANEFRAICRTPDEAVWLVTRMVRLYRKWPGIQEMRHVYASKFANALDGLPAIGESEVFPDGIPAEREPIQDRKLLAAGEAQTASPSLAITVADLARAKSLRRAVAGLSPGIVAEIPVLRPGVKRITAADCDREAEKLRAAAALQLMNKVASHA